MNAETVNSPSWGQFNKHNPLISIFTLCLKPKKELEILSRGPSILTGDGRRAQLSNSGQRDVCQHQGWCGTLCTDGQDRSLPPGPQACPTCRDVVCGSCKASSGKPWLQPHEVVISHRHLRGSPMSLLAAAAIQKQKFLGAY